MALLLARGAAADGAECVLPESGRGSAAPAAEGGSSCPSSRASDASGDSNHAEEERAEELMAQLQRMIHARLFQGQVSSGPLLCILTNRAI